MYLRSMLCMDVRKEIHRTTKRHKERERERERQGERERPSWSVTRGVVLRSG